MFDRDGNGFICRVVDEYRATSRDDELGQEAHRQRECVQNMLMHCQPQTKSTSQSESQVQSEAPRKKRVQTKTEKHTFSRSRYTAFSRRRRRKEAFTEGPIKAIAEFRAWGRPRAS